MNRTDAAWLVLAAVVVCVAVLAIEAVSSFAGPVASLFFAR